MTVTDHKWLDPNCNENGCQSLVLRESYQELITALAMHSKQMTYAGNGKQFVDAVINNLDEVDDILPDSLNRPLVERIKGLLERANREAKLAVEFNKARERAEEALREADDRRKQDAENINAIAQDDSKSLGQRCLMVLAYTTGMSLRKEAFASLKSSEGAK